MAGQETYLPRNSQSFNLELCSSRFASTLRRYSLACHLIARRNCMIVCRNLNLKTSKVCVKNVRLALHNAPPASITFPFKFAFQSRLHFSLSLGLIQILMSVCLVRLLYLCRRQLVSKRLPFHLYASLTLNPKMNLNSLLVHHIRTRITPFCGNRTVDRGLSLVVFLFVKQSVFS